MLWYFRVLRNFSFNGRARRREYWYFLLFHFIALFILVVISDAFGLVVPAHAQTYHYEYYTYYRVPVLIYFLLTVVQSLAVIVRRLHDRNMSGWWILPLAVPFLGSIPALIIFCLPGTAGPHKN